MIDFDETGLYKGFVKNQKGKKFPGRNPQLLTLPEVDAFDSFSGIMKPNTVLIDADEEPHNEILQNIIKGEKLACYMTDRKGGRGVHVLMINSNMSLKKSDKVMLACGVVVDFHPGYSLPYECLKFNRTERNAVYNEQPYQEIPKYFTPLPKCTIDFTNLGEGDGRNSTLFSYILTLQNAGLDKDDIRETIRIINQYVLAEPIEQSELDVILRDEAFKKQSFFVKNKFLHDRFAEYIRTQYYIKKINNQLHIYEDGVYIPCSLAIERAMVQEISSLTDNQRKEVLKYLNVICVEEKHQDYLNLIAFRNGIYNIDTNTLEPFNPEIIITNKIPWDYNPYATSELIDTVLDRLSCNDKEIRYSLEEVAGACLYRSATIGGGKCAVLVGDKHNGKSTYLHMIETMLGKENYSAVDMGDLKDRFSTIMMFGKLANIGDDISSEYIADTSTLKKMITGEVVKAEQKGSPAINFTPYAMHIYSANDIPRMKDRTGAMQRRLLLIPLNGKFTVDSPDYDPAIRYKLGQAEHMEYFIQCALDGLADLLENKTFRTPEQVKEKLAEYEVENNPVLSFIEDQGKENIINELTDDVYTRYQVFCAGNGFQAGSKLTFSKKINQLLGTTSKQSWINGKNRKVFSLS
nr:MAG TPA: dsDNA helicase [Caudoviricetes sp.]